MEPAARVNAWYVSPTLNLRSVIVLVLALACRVKDPAYIPGGLYSAPHDDGKYIVLKVLKVEPEGIHVRTYSNLFSERPRDVDESKLYMAGIDHKPTEAMGMGHVPIARESFKGWQAELIKVVAVREEELEGYRMWLDAKGGYFD